MKIAVCPGSFDPITVGHLDLVERGAALFDQVILCVMVNGEKHPMFTPEERLEMARAALSHIPNASAEAWDGLLADFARKKGACALIKGVRNGIDFEWEYQMAQINRGLLPELDTLLLPARAGAPPHQFHHGAGYDPLPSDIRPMHARSGGGCSPKDQGREGILRWRTMFSI